MVKMVRQLSYPNIQIVLYTKKFKNWIVALLYRYIVKFFLFWVPMNIQKDWKAKLKSAYSFMFKYSKITVCGDKVSTT